MSQNDTKYSHIVTTEHQKEVIDSVSNGDIFNDLDGPLTQFWRLLRHFRSWISKKNGATYGHSYYSTLICNLWNGTMIGDLDWPLNAPRGFVSISWVSCCYSSGCMQIPGCGWVNCHLQMSGASGTAVNYVVEVFRKIMPVLGRNNNLF